MSGGGRRLFASSAHPSSRSESSPRLVANTVPSTPMMSPRSRPTRRSKDSSPSTSRARVQLDPARAVDEVDEGGLAVAAPRGDPARDPIAVVGLLAGVEPLVRLAYARAISVRSANSCGNGSTPASRRRSSFSRRSARSCDSGALAGGRCSSRSRHRRRAYVTQLNRADEPRRLRSW